MDEARTHDRIVDTPRAYRRSLAWARISLIANVVLAIVKLIAGLVGHSYALVADAVESMTDVFGSIIVWGGLRIAAMPADEDHPYGHGKAEPLAALAVGLMLFGAGIGIATQAVREIISPSHGPAAFTIWVLLAVVIIKETLYRVGRLIARREGSCAIDSDAGHHRSDALTSLAAGIGISISLVGGPGYESAEDWAALLASFVIVVNACRLIVHPIRDLMDTLPEGVTDEVRQIARAVPEVRGVEKVLARKAGLRLFVDMHLEVDPMMTVQEAHRVAHEAKDAIMAQMPIVEDVLIHIEPCGTSST
jgi:cation diffusion facilitator family transporter